MLNVELMEVLIKATIPPMTGEEYSFFEENHEIIRTYESDKNFQTTQCEPKDGEPGLLFHEFIFLLGRIACNCVNTSDNIAGKLNDFFVEKLGFHRLLDINRSHMTYDDVTKKFAHTGAGSDEEDIFSDEEGEEGWETESEMDEQQKAFMDFLAKKAEEEKDFIIDYE